MPGPQASILARQPAPATAPTIESAEQLSFFDTGTPELIAQTPLPVLPSVEQQRVEIEQSSQQTAGADTPAAAALAIASLLMLPTTFLIFLVVTRQTR